MDADAKIQQYLLLGKSARGRALVDLITKATSEPGLFAFGELLDLPNVKEFADGEHAPYLALLRLFAYGTWAQYKAVQDASMPTLTPQQTLKLKQLTIISLATQKKVLPYSQLQSELEIGSVRELEDFIITECFYARIVKGKLDQAQRCLQVHDVSSRDVRPEDLPAVAAGLTNWLQQTQSVLAAIEQNILHAAQTADAATQHKASYTAKLDEARKNVKAELDIKGGETSMMMVEDTIPYEYMDEDRTATTARAKSRRR